MLTIHKRFIFALVTISVIFSFGLAVFGNYTAALANVPAAAVYTWQQSVTGDWQTASNWLPARTKPMVSDVLVFNARGTTTVTNVPTQTIGQLIVSGNTTVNLQSETDIFLTIGGGDGDDLVIAPDSALNFNGGKAIVANLDTGSTGAIKGAMTFSSSGNAAHRLTAVEVGAITLKGSAVFTAGSGFSGNPFGKTNLNSVIFDSGATYICVAGDDPFGAPEPDSVVVFNHGSLFSLQGNVTPSVSGRTYANFELNSPGANVTATGSSPLVMDDLTLTAGFFRLNVTGNPGHSIKGDITTAAGTLLDLSPMQPGTVRINGTTPQIFNRTGAMGISGTSTIAIDNPMGVTISNASLAAWNLELINGVVTVTDPTWQISVGGTITRTNGYVNGFLDRFIMTTGTYVFDVGTENGYSPVTVNVTAMTRPATVLYVRAVESTEVHILDPSKALTRYWELLQADDLTADLTFHYLDPPDIPATANESNFVIQRYNGAFFEQPGGVIDTSANTFHVAGVTHFNRDWTLSESSGVPTPTPTATPTASPTPTPPLRTPYDFDGDRKADLSVFRPSSGEWFIRPSDGSGDRATQFGAPGDLIAPADYDGDGRTDLAVYRPSQGIWYVMDSSTSVVTTTNFGIAEDIPVPGDYDGDGRADIANYRPSVGTWYLLRSLIGLEIKQYGMSGDVPAPGDYDGDGRNDLVVWRPPTGVWYERRSQFGDYAVQFGNATDKIAPADYDSDGKMDVGIYRPSIGTWYSINSLNVTYPVTVFGLATDIPVPADYDGDGRADVAIYRPSTGEWWLNRTTSGLTVTQFGSNGDKPTESAFGN